MAGDGGRDLDQEWGELLDEVRVLLPGTQVLFAFLLTIPFTNRFGEVSGLDRLVYFTAFLSTAVAAALLTAPSIYHRLLWRRHDKEHVLRATSRLTIVGGVFLAAATTAAVFVVTDIIYGSTVGAVTAAVMATTTGWFWFGRALRRRARQAR